MHHRQQLFLRWLSGAGTSQEVWSLIWRHSQAPLTSPSFITLQRLLWCSTASSSSNFQTNFARSRHLRYRWYDLVLCSLSLLVVYNLTPWYHGCSNSTSLDHSMSMETPQRHFMIVPGAFLGNVFDQETRRPWERRSIVHHRQQLFWGSWALQARHRRYGVWFGASVKHQRHFLFTSSYLVS